MATTHTRVALIAGASGLVGGHILQQLLEDATVSEVHVLARRALKVEHPKLRAHIVVFNELPALPNVDEVYLALGTTISVAGSKDAFRAVDLFANLAVAKAAIESGAKRVGLVSAAGADATSSVFYNKTKGELESALKALNLDTLVITRPSLLLGDREALKQPFRLGEKIAIPIATLLAPILPATYRPVNAADVAKALVSLLPTKNGIVELTSEDISNIGRRKPSVPKSNHSL